MALTKITTSVVAVNSLTAANIADNSIDATKIANNQILARHIAAGALSDQIADNSIGISELNVSDGSSGQFLKTDGSGTLSFATVDLSTKANLASPSFTGTVTITGASSAYNTLQLTSNSTGHGTIINLGDTSDADYGSITQFASSAGEGGRMRFIAGTTEAMNLRGVNVGIGTSSPDNFSGYRVLDVRGSTHGGIFQSKASGNQTARLYATTAAGYVGTSSNDTFNILANDAERMQFEPNGQINLGMGQSHSYIPAYDQSTGYTNNLNAGSFGILHRNGYDSYITGNTYYYKTGGTAGWKAKYPAYKSGVLSMLDGRFQFDCSNAAPGGSGVVAVSGLAPVVRIDSDGLKFNTDTAAANALDDYEEGTFTPTFSTSNSTATGLYQKVGNTVTVFVHVVSTGGLPSSGGQVQIGNLPFTSASNHISAGPIYIGPSNVSSATGGGGQISIIMEGSATVVRFVNVDTGTLGYTLWGELEVSSNNVVTAIGSITYQV